ncbi:hypothetical protein PAXINDRAFT_15637 [Paxillus involutus ATCC 200175]|uniref:Uncharacterized protein n=1 Tax=Paxillus involutus ATCC 200175 TaxID=664439 RepID=A0A0C9TW60_PAXIN|nr:hypothetical protein PAXINDRAFT_15637 [Paxillus involutus ATCC 200175]
MAHNNTPSKKLSRPSNWDISQGIKPARGKPTQQLPKNLLSNSLNMQFLTLLASIASLSAYTLVGVHARVCAVCPSEVNGGRLTKYCVGPIGHSYCKYDGLGAYCIYGVRT